MNLLSLVCVVSFTVLTAPLVQATCTDYAVFVRSYNIQRRGITYRASCGYNCLSNDTTQQDCSAAVPAQTFDLFRWYHPSNFTEETYATLYSTVGSQAFNESGDLWRQPVTITTRDGVSIPLNSDQTYGYNRTAGWATFEPLYECARGMVNGCTDGFQVRDGTVIEICRGHSISTGSIVWEERSRAEAQSVTDVQLRYASPSGNGSTTQPIFPPQDTPGQTGAASISSGARAEAVVLTALAILLVGMFS